jgi:hypothetical protein
MTETIIDMNDEDNCCTCALCGGHRAAYSDPPVCPDCRGDWEVEVAFNKWAREQVQDGDLWP